MVAYVNKEYSTYQFSEESKGGGIHPPPVLAVPKKRGPERVKLIFFYIINRKPNKKIYSC